ncbi:hypothetical protein DOY81_011107 [Sarcophaga bullata]|nr:hypothetical protein DOY81_011107 [Sarcophaga bullata]
MLIANGMENEALIQRQRVKELEDYLDNLLLRVMETHPKILQNPYSRTTSAKRKYLPLTAFIMKIFKYFYLNEKRADN